MPNEILNAKITSTKLGEEHGCLTADIVLESSGCGCVYGGYCLDHWCADVGKHTSTDGYGAIIELMKTFEVESWEELVGRYVRVETEGWGGEIVRIGHLMKENWFSFKDYFEKVKEIKESKRINLSSTSNVINEVLKATSKTPTKEEAMEMLRSCGVLNDKNEPGIGWESYK